MVLIMMSVPRYTVRETGQCHTGLWWGNWKNHLQDLGIEGRIILKWIFKKCDVRHGLDWSSSGEGHMTVFCESGDEPSGSKIMRGISW